MTAPQDIVGLYLAATVTARRSPTWRGGVWQDAELDADAPPSALAAQQLARVLRDAMTQTATGQRALAAASGVARTTIGRILAGTVLCDIGSLARLEHALGRRLWPEHIGPTSPRTKRRVIA